jgi:hypothetical protein
VGDKISSPNLLLNFLFISIHAEKKLWLKILRIKLTSFVPRKRRVELRVKRKEEENPMVGTTLPKGVSFFFSHLYFCNSIIVCYVENTNEIS